MRRTVARVEEAAYLMDRPVAHLSCGHGAFAAMGMLGALFEL